MEHPVSLIRLFTDLYFFHFSVRPYCLQIYIHFFYLVVYSLHIFFLWKSSLNGLSKNQRRTKHDKLNPHHEEMHSSAFVWKCLLYESFNFVRCYLFALQFIYMVRANEKVMCTVIASGTFHLIAPSSIFHYLSSQIKNADELFSQGNFCAIITFCTSTLLFYERIHFIIYLQLSSYCHIIYYKIVISVRFKFLSARSFRIEHFWDGDYFPLIKYDAIY